MSNPISVKVSPRHQISLPSHARKKLNIQAGDRLLVDIQDGMIILMPQPDNHVSHMAGLYQEVWQGIDTTNYLNEEREAWLASDKT